MKAAGNDQLPPIQVAAAVLIRSDGHFLLAQRPKGKVYSGYWEFPGGKLEPGEPVAAALARELQEELGIEVRTAYPWLVQRYRYPHGYVQLNFYRVVEWEGDPHPHEKQALAWVPAGDPRVAPILPANAPILRALALPPEMGISNAQELGIVEFLRRLEDALERGLRMVMIREPGMPRESFHTLTHAVVMRCRAAGALVLVHGDVEVCRSVGADGVHFSARQLNELRGRPDVRLCGASCHDADELARGHSMNMDYALLGPVLPTPTHPDHAGLGWTRVEQLLCEAMLPVYLIGGMRETELNRAWQAGAHGIAMLRHAWRE